MARNVISAERVAVKTVMQMSEASSPAPCKRIGSDEKSRPNAKSAWTAGAEARPSEMAMQISHAANVRAPCERSISIHGMETHDLFSRW